MFRSKTCDLNAVDNCSSRSLFCSFILNISASQDSTESKGHGKMNGATTTINANFTCFSMTCIRERATFRALSFVSSSCCNCARESGSPVCTPAVCGDDQRLMLWSSLSCSCARILLISREPRSLERGVAKPGISLGSICISNQVLYQVRVLRVCGKKGIQHTCLTVGVAGTVPLERLEL